MNLDTLSRDQLCALLGLYQATAEVRLTLNQALLEKIPGADLEQVLAEMSAWAGFHNELTTRSHAEIQRILAGDVEAPAKLN